MKPNSEYIKTRMRGWVDGACGCQFDDENEPTPQHARVYRMGYAAGKKAKSAALFAAKHDQHEAKI